jgi:hypothetical protein
MQYLLACKDLYSEAKVCCSWVVSDLTARQVLGSILSRTILWVISQSTYISRVQSSVWRLPNYWPTTPSPPSGCVLPRTKGGPGGGTHSPGCGEVGGQYFGRRRTLDWPLRVIFSSLNYVQPWRKRRNPPYNFCEKSRYYIKIPWKIHKNNERKG